MKRWARVLLLAIGLALLAGCSNLKLIYSQAPELSYWWIDDYADFDGTQKSQARAALKSFFLWNRQTQLPEYSALLARLESHVTSNVTGTQVCGWYDEAVSKAEVAGERALSAAVGIARTLTHEQIEHIEKRFEKKNRSWIESHLQESQGDRVKAAFKRARERADLVYGSLEPEQRERLMQGLASSPYDPRMALAERRARQQEFVQALRRVSAPGVGNEEAVGALRTAMKHALHSPNEAYRAYRERQAEYDCALTAELHNSATPGQRAAASKRFAGWQEDLRALGAAGIAP